MTLGAPIPFSEAIRRNAVRKVMPTHLGTEDLQQMDRGILRSSFFSARNAIREFLGAAKAAVEKIINPVQTQREDRVEPSNPEGNVTVGMNDAQARVALRQILKDSGYSPDPEDRGTIKDFASDQRLNLVIRTNTQIAQGYGQWQQGMDPAILDEFPAQELFRAEARKQERDWAARWLAAARDAGDAEAVTAYGTTGRLVARKDSAVWQSLGDGAGGYDADALHNPYPPFAFTSGMDVRDIDRDEAVSLGLIGRDDQVTPQSQEFGAGLPEDAEAIA